jgi:hypothetical protein
MIKTNKRSKIDLIEKASAEIASETFSGGNGDTWKEKKIAVEEKQKKEEVKPSTEPIVDDKTPNWNDNSATLKVLGLIAAIALGVYLIKKYK